MLRYVRFLMEKDLKEFWVQYGPCEKLRFISIHIQSEKLDITLSQVFVKAHVTTDDDAWSKIGTKSGALACKPIDYLANFGEYPVLNDYDIQTVEIFLLKSGQAQDASQKPKL